MPASVHGGRKVKKIGINFPQCLLKGAKTLDDRLTVVDWWIQQTDAKKNEHKKAFAREYFHPTIDDTRRSLRIDSRGARRAEQENIQPRAVSRFDSEEVKRNYLKNTASGVTYENKKKEKRKSTEQVGSLGQLDDGHARRAVLSLEKKFREVCIKTAVDEDIDLNGGGYEVVLVSRLRSAKKTGGRPKKDEHATSTRILADSVASAKSLLGEEQYNMLVAGNDVDVWTHDDSLVNDMPLPAVAKANAAKETRVLKKSRSDTSSAPSLSSTASSSTTSAPPSLSSMTSSSTASMPADSTHSGTGWDFEF